MEKLLKSNIKKILIALIIIAIIIIVIVVVNNFTNSYDDSKNYNIIIKETKGIEIKTYISSEKSQLIVSAINKSGKRIGSGHIKVNYYNENGNKIMVYSTDDQRYNMFENGSQIVLAFELPAENSINYYIPAKTEVEITIDEEYKEQYSTIISKYTENFTYSYSSNANNSITLSLKNNGSNEEFAPRFISVVFYKNNKPVYSKQVNFYLQLVQPGKTKTEEIEVPNDCSKSEETGSDVPIDYDSIKIYRVLDGIN